jgi:hypothetical protein
MEVKQAIDHYVLQKYYEIVCCAFFGFHNIKYRPLRTTEIKEYHRDNFDFSLWPSKNSLWPSVALLVWKQLI